MNISRLLFPLSVSAIFGFGCSNGINVRIEKTPESITAHVETMGEYPTTVKRICLTDVGKNLVIADFVAGKPPTQIHKIKLKLGNNTPADCFPEYDIYDILVPKGNSPFFIEKGRRYLLQIWDGKNIKNDVFLQFD